MKTIEQRKAKLEVIEMCLDAIENASENNFKWERNYMGYDDADIENWTDEKKDGYERLCYKEAVLQSIVNYIENIKV